MWVVVCLNSSKKLAPPRLSISGSATRKSTEFAHRSAFKADLILAHCLRRWPNIRPTLGQCIVFFGMCLLGIIRLFDQAIPANTRGWRNAFLMLGQRRRPSKNTPLPSIRSLLILVVEDIESFSIFSLYK